MSVISLRRRSVAIPLPATGVRVTSQDTTASGSPASGILTATYPATPTPGNLLIACCLARASYDAWTPPSGWTEAARAGNTDGVYDPRGLIYFKVAGQSEPTAVTFQTVLTSQPMEMAIFEFRGFAGTPPNDVTVLASSGASTSVSSLATGTTPATTRANELVVELCFMFAGAVTGAAWATGTTIANVYGGDTLLVGQRVAVTAGATLSDTASWTTARLAATAVATFGVGITPPNPQPGPPQPGAGLAANRLMFWSGAGDIITLSNANLDLLASRGVGGLVLSSGYLYNMGGSNPWTTNPNPATWTQMQQWINQNNIAGRLHARGMKAYLGCHLANFANHNSPLFDWFDDAGWTNYVLPSLQNFAGAAKNLGMDGIAFDEELYAGGSWGWSYPGNTHTEAQVRAAAKLRGQQMMANILAGFPAVEIVDYGTYFPEGWNDKVQEVINGSFGSWDANLQVPMWDGLTSVNGYSAIDFWDATFYKTAHLTGTWEYAFQYAFNRHFAYCSRKFSNWAAAAPRFNYTPFAWIDSDGSAFGSAPSPSYLATQLAAFRLWGMGGTPGGMVGNFCFNPIMSVDYSSYATATQAAAVAGTVDTTAPTLTVNAVAPGQRTITGAATDNFAIRYVAWTQGAASGEATMTWVPISGNYTSGYTWRMDWTFTVPTTGTVTITVEDTKGLRTVQTVSVT